MEEDVLGPRTQVLKRRYSRCGKCGRTFSRSMGRPTGTLAPEEVRVDDAILCPSCRQVVPTDQAVVDPESEEA